MAVKMACSLAVVVMEKVVILTIIVAMTMIDTGAGIAVLTAIAKMKKIVFVLMNGSRTTIAAVTISTEIPLSCRAQRRQQWPLPS